MKLENEITVQVVCSYEELNRQLIDNGFTINEEYQVNDEYMIKSDIDINTMPKLEVLKNCILVRDITGTKKALVYKYKKFADNGDIIEQGNVECPVTDIHKAISFMEAINYRKLFSIHDRCIVYGDKKVELIVQLVNDRYTFIEMEDKGKHLGGKFKSVDEMKEFLDSYNLSYDKTNYFVKKAEIMLNEILSGVKD